MDSDAQDHKQTDKQPGVAAGLDTKSTKVFPCPQCKKALQRKEGKRGVFWACSGFPHCKVTCNDKDGKPATRDDESFRCPVCTRPLVRAPKERGDYWFCSGYSKGCKITLADVSGVPEKAWRCRECGSLLQKRKGKHGEFWGCSQYPECKTSYRDKDNRPEF
jgi:ssDNA-binding Zn-finger/Zn-ribbon topoisomerase 1